MTDLHSALMRNDPQLPAYATAGDVQKLLDAMQGMAMLLKTTNDRLKELEAQVRRLEKVTPAQAAALGAAVRARAAQVCGIHRAAGCEKAAAAAIRKAVKITCGAGTLRDLPRCDYQVAERQIQMWDDYQIMKEIKTKEAKKRADREAEAVRQAEERNL